ncbi:kelch repeat-containing protein [Sphingobacterium sp. SG20118]|uniref:kelch repeat-containing protein n=1 Tax=Sphingobacterium sp. SG20118 TaxID=3367156 RepID=UPI0037DFC7CA
MKIIPLLLSTFIFMQCNTANKNAEIMWSNTDSLPKTVNGQTQLGVAGPLVGIHQNHLLIAGGANFPERMPWEGGIKKYQRSAYIYQIKDQILKLSDTLSFDTSTAYAANCSTKEGIYTAGGENESGASSQFHIYKWNGEQHNFDVQKLSDLPIPLSNASLVASEDKLYLVGGENTTLVSDKIYQYDQEWKEYLTLPYPITHTVAVVKENYLYLFGGRTRETNAISTLYKSCYKIDLKTKEIVQIADLPEALSAGTGFKDDKDRLFLVGGDNGTTFHKVEHLILEIANEANPIHKENLIEEKATIQSKHPGFTKEVLQYNEKSNTWKVVSNLAVGAPVTTTAVYHDQHVYIPSGEIRAGVRSAGILTGTIN